jgi:hypothetical protein
MSKDQPDTRDALMVRHRELLKRRAGTPLESREYQQVAAEVAAVEVEIARIEEPPVELLGKRPDAPPRR